MCSQEMGADFVFAWPTAEIAVMGAEGAVKVLYNKELKAAADPKAKAAELAAAYRAEFASPYMAAGPAHRSENVATLTGGLAHDVSILLGVGRHRGSQPRAKTSITIMRAPQCGHGQRSTRGACYIAGPVVGRLVGERDFGADLRMSN